MKICYVVYREDNVMVFDSQVLEYLQKLALKPGVDDVELIVFRHQQNFRKKEQVENKIKKYLNQYKTFSSIAPPLSIAQLNIDACRLWFYVSTRYSNKDQIAVICRGDFATYISAKAFKNFPNSRILYDNRGIPFEESLMAHPNGMIHAINRKIKKKSILFAKDHCDMYNFVTNAMRDFDLREYGYSEDLPYTIIPTLYHAEEIDQSGLNRIKEREKYQSGDYIITYVGSAAAWQSTEQLVELIKKIDARYNEVRYFILTNGNMPGLEELPIELKNRMTIKGVPHSEMKYYLRISNLGIVIRDNNIVNKVAAPTKIAEYLTSGIRILYSGDIGILSDLSSITGGEQMIQIDEQANWLERIDGDIKNTQRSPKIINEKINKYFDMDSRQMDTIKMLQICFENKKVR